MAPGKDNRRDGRSTTTKVEALRTSDLFHVLGATDRRRVAAAAVLRDHGRGDSVWTRGEACEWVVIPLDGRIKCWIVREDLRAWVRRLVRPGHCCGLVSAVDGAPHPCSAETVQPGRVLSVPTEIVRELARRNPTFAGQLALLLARALRETIHSCELLTLHTPLERLAHYLGEVVDESGAGELGGTQSQIAAQLGTVREVVGRGLRRLESDGIMVRKGRRVQVLRPDALARLGAR